MLWISNRAVKPFDSSFETLVQIKTKTMYLSMKEKIAHLKKKLQICIGLQIETKESLFAWWRNI